MGEDTGLLECLLVPLVDVYTYDDGAGGELRRLVIQEAGVVQGELADLKGHLADNILIIEVEQAQIPLHGLDRVWEIDVEAEALQNFGLHVDDVLLAKLLLFVGRQKTDHALEAGTNRFFEF